MKKHISLILFGLLIFSAVFALSACGGEKNKGVEERFNKA